MGINDLKARAYALAGVTTTQQLKTKYVAIAQLNLRLKASWQKAIAFLETKPVSDRVNPKTLSKLKAEVYAIAQVSTTQQLKAKYASLNALNFSFRTSWERALKLLASDPQDFQSWLANPPEEYKDLFAEIETTSQEFSTKLERAKRLGEEAQKMATSLEQLAQEAQDESEQMWQEAELAYRVAQQAKLN
ncbi:hypothetical protein PGN35_029070 [Nodosilinea sp. PGN35]|uniref:hypothetical protein n=1 Tax=Nodosilinea sp. PGN35 TaxID=3020489 RepID=UPI0023B2AE58|nr:hypothetical protein [Nodosilinea sp. TSF1-S3]MDF0368242.1 hypothetical protein [Nodosilinea sp. TSF1-S3]